MVRYHGLLVLADNVADNFNIESFRNIPPVPADSDGSGLTKLREHLERQGRLREARAVLDVELPFLDRPTKQNACQSVIEACKFPARFEPAWFIECRARLQLAQALRKASQNPEADQEFELARSLSDRAPVSALQNNINLDVRLGELKSATVSDIQPKLDAWIEFFEKSSVCKDHFMMSEALDNAASIALEMLEKEPNDENRVRFWKWQSQGEDLLERVGDIYFLLMRRILTGEVALRLFDQSGVILQWHEDFEAKYSNFQLRGLQIIAKRTKLVIYLRLNDANNIFKTVNEIKEIEHERDAFWSEEDRSLPKAIQRRGDELEQGTQVDAPYKPGLLQDLWLEEWSNEIPLNYQSDARFQLGTLEVKNAIATEEVLLRWMRLASKEGDLSKSDLECILYHQDQTNGDADAVDLLAQVSAERFSDTLYGSESSPITHRHWEATFTILSHWLLEKAKYNEVKKSYLLLSLQEKRISRMLKEKFSYQDQLKLTQTTLELIPRLAWLMPDLSISNAITWRNRLCFVKQNLYYEEQGHVFWTEDDPQFQEILTLFQLSLQQARGIGRLDLEATISMNIAHLYYSPALCLRQKAFEGFFQSLDDAEIAYQKSREGWKFLRGWDKVEKLLMAAEEEMRLRIAPLAVSVLMKMPGSENPASEFALPIWTMIQIAKSLGLGWLTRTNGLEKSEKSQPETAKLDLEFNETLPITPDDLNIITADAEDNIVYVDWYNGSWVNQTVHNPLFAAVIPGKSVQVFLVKMTWVEVNTILDKILKFSTDDLLTDEAQEFLWKLNPLIEPLAAISQPGQVLVFSPDSNLHRIPLHALQLENVLLIRRNPIVYCSNMTVLHVAFQARKAAEQKSLEAQRLFQPALFGDPPSDAGTTALKALAKKFSVQPHIGDAFTSFNFASAISDPSLDLFHYHGHVVFEEQKPIDHCLQFGDRDVTLRDVFALAPVPGSYHATLLGCGSGMSKTHVSSDVVGLVPAFLYSGAASTVSTLWSFADADAAMYAHYFYEEFRQVVRTGIGTRVNLARANQRAVLAVMEKRPELYHWAPFVLNGYWMMEVRGRNRGV